MSIVPYERSVFKVPFKIHESNVEILAVQIPTA